MNIHIEFSSQASERLVAAAQVRGVDLKTILEGLVVEYLPPVESPSSAVQLRPPGRAAQRLRDRLVAEATDDPQEIQSAQESLDEMKRSMNAERTRSGAEPIF